MASTEQQIRFEHWAKWQSLNAIARAKHDVPEAASLLAHIVSISNLWAARVESIDMGIDPWPILAIPELKTELNRLLDRWMALSACFLSDVRVQYRSRDGGQRSNLFSEILQEVLLHSAHHRGQIALVLRMKGSEPPHSTDFIPALRTGAL